MEKVPQNNNIFYFFISRTSTVGKRFSEKKVSGFRIFGQNTIREKVRSGKTADTLK